MKILLLIQIIFVLIGACYGEVPNEFIIIPGVKNNIKEVKQGLETLGCDFKQCDNSIFVPEQSLDKIKFILRLSKYIEYDEIWFNSHTKEVVESISLQSTETFTKMTVIDDVDPRYLRQTLDILDSWRILYCNYKGFIAIENASKEKVLKKLTAKGFLMFPEGIERLLPPSAKAKPPKHSTDIYFPALKSESEEERLIREEQLLQARDIFNRISSLLLSIDGIYEIQIDRLESFKWKAIVLYPQNYQWKPNQREKIQEECITSLKKAGTLKHPSDFTLLL